MFNYVFTFSSLGLPYLFCKCQFKSYSSHTWSVSCIVNMCIIINVCLLSFLTEFINLFHFSSTSVIHLVYLWSHSSAISFILQLMYHPSCFYPSYMSSTMCIIYVMHHESYVSSTSCIIHPPFNVSSVLSFYLSHVSPTSCIIHPTSHVSCISCIIHLMYYRFSCNVFLHLIYYIISHVLSMSCIIHLMHYPCIIHLLYHPSHVSFICVSSISCIIHVSSIQTSHWSQQDMYSVFSQWTLRLFKHALSYDCQTCTLVWLSNMDYQIKHGLSDDCHTCTLRWLSNK